MISIPLIANLAHAHRFSGKSVVFILAIREAEIFYNYNIAKNRVKIVLLRVSFTWT